MQASLMTKTTAVVKSTLWSTRAHKHLVRSWKSLLLLVLLALAAVLASCGAAAQAKPEPTIECIVIDPSSVYYRDPIDFEWTPAIQDLADQDGSYEYAIEYFRWMADFVEEDDDERDFIAKNNLACALLLSIAENGSVRDAATGAPNPVTYVAWRSPLYDHEPSTALETCWEVIETLEDAESESLDRSLSSRKSVAAMLRTLNCELGSVRVEIDIQPLGTPLIRLEVEMPEQSLAVLKLVTPFIDGYGPERSLSSDARFVNFGFAKEGMHCYYLEHVEQDGQEIDGDSVGALYVDAAEIPATGFLTKNYQVSLVPSGAGQAIRLQDDGPDSFAVEFVMDNSDFYSWSMSYASVQLQLNKRRMDLIYLSSSNPRQTQEVPLTFSGSTEVVYTILLDDRPVATGRIAAVADGDVFRVYVGSDSASLERLTCLSDGNLTDLATAIARLDTLASDGLDSPVKKDNFVTALKRALALTDPASGVTSTTWNLLCWWGALSGESQRVVETACNEAVDTAPFSTSTLAAHLYNRGVARALEGEMAEAMADFKAALTSGALDDAGERAKWVNDLQNGALPEDVFDYYTLLDLGPE